MLADAVENIVGLSSSFPRDDYETRFSSRDIFPILLAPSRPRSTMRLNLSPRNGRTPSRKDGRSATLVGNRERRIKFASVA